MTEQEHATVDRVVARYLGPEMLYARTRLAFGSAVNSSTVAAALAWYRSPLGRRIVAADLDVAADGGRPVTMDQPSAERLPLIERLDEAGGAPPGPPRITTAPGPGPAPPPGLVLSGPPTPRARPAPPPSNL